MSDLDAQLARFRAASGGLTQVCILRSTDEVALRAHDDPLSASLLETLAGLKAEITSGKRHPCVGCGKRVRVPGFVALVPAMISAPTEMLCRAICGRCSDAAIMAAIQRELGAQLVPISRGGRA